MFNAFHFWFLSRVKNSSTTTTESQTTTVSASAAEETTGKFMSKALLWYFVCNLPVCYSKNLASENGSLAEKLKNCIAVSELG